MNLKNLTDQALHEGAKNVAHTERESLTSMLHHLREIERRKLYSKFKYSSLFEYAISELKYSEPQAGRRISAMRLLRDVPDIEEKITSGALTLTNMVLAQTLFSKEKKSGRKFDMEKKTEVLSRLEDKTTRAGQKIVCEIAPTMKAPSKQLDYDSIEDNDLREKLLRIKGLYAHIDPNMSFFDLLHKLCDLGLSRKSLSAPRVKPDSQAEIRRKVWRRDQGKCTNCGSMHALQLDHIVPQSVGGLSTAENLRLLCRRCNQRAAIDYFGIEKMTPYLRSIQREYVLDGKVANRQNKWHA